MDQAKHNYLKSIDMDYRLLVRKIEELESKDKLDSGEEEHLDVLIQLRDEKLDNIELGR